MGKQAHDEMTELEQTSVTADPTRVRKRPGPKPGRRPGQKPRGAGHVGNGNGVVVPVSALAALKHELATTEAQAGRLKRALAVLEG